MPAKDTILIFQNPSLYFFPHYSDITYSPFCVREKSLPYLVYRVLHILHIPLCSVFWGDWKNHLKDAKRVIIFDYGYQRGMETYIKKINPGCQVFLFMWNHIDRYHHNHVIFSDKSAIYSTDPSDCARYGLKYNHIFYPKEYARLSENTSACEGYDNVSDTPRTKNRLFFMGVDKNRVSYIMSLRSSFMSCGIECDIRVLSGSKEPDYLNSCDPILVSSPLSYDEYLREVCGSDILLDVPQDGQTALTMRVMESIYLSKKLITGNQDIVRYDFFNSDNIYVLPSDKSMPDAASLCAFLDKPFQPYSKRIIETYSFEHWLSAF